MVKYKCGSCGYVFDAEEMIKVFGRITCPKCTYGIVYKVAKVYRLVKAV